MIFFFNGKIYTIYPSEASTHVLWSQGVNWPITSMLCTEKLVPQTCLQKWEYLAASETKSHHSAASLEQYMVCQLQKWFPAQCFSEITLSWLPFQPQFHQFKCLKQSGKDDPHHDPTKTLSPYTSSSNPALTSGSLVLSQVPRRKQRGKDNCASAPIWKGASGSLQLWWKKKKTVLAIWSDC